MTNVTTIDKFLARRYLQAKATSNRQVLKIIADLPVQCDIVPGMALIKNLCDVSVEIPDSWMSAMDIVFEMHPVKDTLVTPHLEMTLGTGIRDGVDKTTGDVFLTLRGHVSNVTFMSVDADAGFIPLDTFLKEHLAEHGEEVWNFFTFAASAFKCVSEYARYSVVLKTPSRIVIKSEFEGENGYSLLDCNFEPSYADHAYIEEMIKDQPNA
jgi:hypothetical protein